VVFLERLDLPEAAVAGGFNHIAHRNQVLVRKRINVGTAVSGHADACEAELGIGRGSRQDVGRWKEVRAGGGRRQGRRSSKELTSVQT
jgi:hypothetical protein